MHRDKQIELHIIFQKEG
ncbi:hypothetical protein Gotur_034413 [Gossypium turneri]